MFLCCPLNFCLCMKLEGTAQKLLHRCYFLWHVDIIIWNVSEDLLTSRTLPVPCSCCMAACRSQSATCGNSSTPLWMRKHLKPATPAWIMGRSSSYNCTSVICGCVWSNSVQLRMCSFGPGWFRCTWLPGITPPQKAVSTKHFPVASCSFSWKWQSVVVGGMLFLKKTTTTKIIAVTSYRSWLHQKHLRGQPALSLKHWMG